MNVFSKEMFVLKNVITASVHQLFLLGWWAECRWWCGGMQGYRTPVSPSQTRLYRLNEGTCGIREPRLAHHHQDVSQSPCSQPPRGRTLEQHSPRRAIQSWSFTGFSVEWGPLHLSTTRLLAALWGNRRDAPHPWAYEHRALETTYTFSGLSEHHCYFLFLFLPHWV